MDVREQCERFKTIPEELRCVPHWVCWEMRPPKEEGKKPRKVPINPKTGWEAKSTAPDTWGSFEQALEMYKRQPERLKGIGWVFVQGGGYFGVDLDRKEGKPVLFDEFIDALQSYNEISQSGTGIHIICKGSLPKGGRRNDNVGVEMYETGRYFVFTGVQYNAKYMEIRDCTEQIKPLFQEYIPEKAKPKQERVCVPVSLDDERLLQIIRLSRNGTKFQILYEGAWECLGYGSQSNADLALCSMLAFWTGRDAGRMDALFRSSGLMRKKWDERRGARTYGEITIQTAIDGCAEIYKPDEGLDVLDWDSVIGS